jgi:iron complex transport system substrate-binding protein
VIRTRHLLTVLLAAAGIAAGACSSSDAGSGSTSSAPASSPAAPASGADTSAAASTSSSSATSGSATSGSATGGSATSASPQLPAGVDTMFGTVDVPAPADGRLKVVALGWSDAEMALALGVVPVAVYDWQGFGEDNKGVGPWATELFGDVIPTVIPNSQQNLNYEQISALNPDVILNVRSSQDPDVAKRLQSIAPTVYAPKDTPAFATAWDVQMRQIAAALGEKEAGEKIISDIEGRIDAAAKANPQFSGHTVASGTKFGEAYGAYVAGDLRFDILADLGFTQNPAVSKLPTSGFFTAVSAENISALDADVTVMLPIGFSLADTENDQLIESLDAVKEHRTVFIDPDSELSGAWSAGSVLSIPVVLEQMVPQLAAAVDGKAGVPGSTAPTS